MEFLEIDILVHWKGINVRNIGEIGKRYPNIYHPQNMLEKIYLITSPKYCQTYTNGKSNK